jgi:TatD DNase family protein
MPWIDTHCHLDAPEFDLDRLAVRQAAREAGVDLCVYPAVAASNWQAVQELAHATGDVYALGIHPLYTPQASESDLLDLEQALQRARSDARLVAVGEIGLDFFEPHLCSPEMRRKQWHFYTAQLALAQALQLPVILHVRRSVDMVLKGLRRSGTAMRAQAHGGIAHAFNGSAQQAAAFGKLGFALGFGGAVTFERALQLRRLAMQLPEQHLVLETDAPDIPPHWLYQSAQARASGAAQGRNAPDQLPRIAQVVADLRDVPLHDLQAQSSAAALAALPRCRPFFSP